MLFFLKKKENFEKPLSLPNGEVRPFGFSRLKIIEFFAVLAQTNYTCIYDEMIKLGIFASCMQTFFDYPWNNFLHSTIEWMIQGILMRKNDNVKIHLLKDCKLLDKIAEASKINEEECSKPKGVRRGYMGHITSISVGILTAGVHSQLAQKVLTENEEWDKYSKGPLLVTLRREGKSLESILAAPIPTVSTQDPIEHYEHVGEPSIGKQEQMDIDYLNSD